MFPPLIWALQFHFPPWGRGYVFILPTQPPLASACRRPADGGPGLQGTLTCPQSPKCLSDQSQQPKGVKYKCPNQSNFPGSEAAIPPIHTPAWLAEGLGSEKKILRLREVRSVV